MTIIDELKPCPFCGGNKARIEKVLREGYQGEENDPDAYAYYGFCPFCAAQGPWKKSVSGAVHMWNGIAGKNFDARPLEKQLQAELQAAREDAERLAKKGAHISRCLRVLVDYDKMNPGLDRTSEEGALTEWKATLAAHEALKGQP